MLSRLRRDGVTEGISGDVVKDAGQASLDLLTHHVLPTACLLMDEPAVQADDVQEQPFSKPVLADHFSGPPAALVGELEGAVVGNLDEAVTLHTRHRLGDRGPRVVEALDNAGAQRWNAVLLKLIDGLEVHLGGVDQLAHEVGSCLRWVTATARVRKRASSLRRAS